MLTSMKTAMCEKIVAEARAEYGDDFTFADLTRTIDDLVEGGYVYKTFVRGQVAQYLGWA